MRYKICFGAGFASGYYFGAKAGRQRYDEINRTLRRLRRSPKVEAATEKARHVLEQRVDLAVDKAKAVVGEGVDKAKQVVGRKSNGSSSMTDGSSNGVPGSPYSSSK